MGAHGQNLAMARSILDNTSDNLIPFNPLDPPNEVENFVPFELKTHHYLGQTARHNHTPTARFHVIEGSGAEELFHVYGLTDALPN
jgi:hypothetical protein